MEWFVVWIVMAVIVAMVAASKGRSGVGWFFYGLLIWPIALTHALLSKRPADALARADLLAAAQTAAAELPTPGEDMKFLPAPPPGHVWVYNTARAAKVRGVTLTDADGTPRQELIAELAPGDRLALGGKADGEAANESGGEGAPVAVLLPGASPERPRGAIGHLDPDTSERVRGWLDDPKYAVLARVKEITGGNAARLAYGVEIEIRVFFLSAWPKP